MRRLRILAVTAGLVATGACVGALAAATIVVALFPREGLGHLSANSGAAFAAAAALGAAIGAVAGPALAWALLRTVPLGRAVGWTAVGTVVGAAIGEWANPLNPYASDLPGVLQGAALGFLAAGLGLRLHAMRPRKVTSADRAV